MTHTYYGLLAALIMLSVSASMIFIPGLPVNQNNLKHLQAATDVLENDLEGTYKPKQKYSSKGRSNRTTY